MGGRRRWQELLQQLSEELERQSSRLEQLERGRDVEPDINASGSLGITAGSSSFSQDPSRSKSFSLSVRSNWTAKALRQGRSRSSVLTPSAGWAIAPQGFFYSTVWYFVMTTSSIYVGLITPIQAFAVDLDSTFLLVGLCVDAAFVADMVLQFFVQISIPTSLGVKRISKLSIIAKNYLTGWFVFDFAVAMPFDLLGLALHWPEGAIRLLWLSKLLRLVKWSRLSKVLTVPFSIQHQQEWLLLRFLGLLILLCHWFACLWNLALPLAPRGAPTWLTDSNANQESSGLPPITKWQSYLMGFYFSSYTMTSVGYGDIGPKNDLEMGICTLMVVCTGFTWAYVLGQICTIVSGMNEDSQAFRMRMHNLNAMMQTEDLPASLQERLRQFFLHNRNLAQHLNYQNLLSSMSPQLQSEVCFASNLEWLRKVSFFDEFIKLFESLKHQGMPAGSYRSCIAEISRRLKCHAFAQEETFESSQVLCILSKGLCLVNGVLQHKGDVWGEDFVLADRQLARTLRCQALTYIEILHLSRASLMEVIEEKRFACPRLGDVVHSFRRRLAARRAILLEAKSRRKKFPL